MDGLRETISKVNNMIEKQVNILINDFAAESFAGGKMDNFKRSSSGENSEVVQRHQRTGD